MAMHRRLLTGAMLAGALAVPAGAGATSCGGVALDPRFHEAVALCGRAEPAMPQLAQATDAPVAAAADRGALDSRSVSIAMPGMRAAPHGSTPRSRNARSRTGLRRPAASPTPLVAAISRRYRIDPHLFASMMRQESGGRLDAVSGKGALGLMQVMPATARSVGVAEPKAMLTNPVLALSAGAVYLKRLQKQFGNDVPLVLAAYNAGPGAVVKAGRRIPKYRETQGYVGAIMQRWQRTRQGH